MIFQQPASIARVFGLALCLVSTCLAVSQTLEILGKAPHIASWRILGDFGFLACLAFSLTILGEWLWSFEEGWDRLKRALRIGQILLLTGGLLFGLTIRVEKALNLL